MSHSTQVKIICGTQEYSFVYGSRQPAESLKVACGCSFDYHNLSALDVLLTLRTHGYAWLINGFVGTNKADFKDYMTYYPNDNWLTVTVSHYD